MTGPSIERERGAELEPHQTLDSGRKERGFKGITGRGRKSGKSTEGGSLRAWTERPYQTIAKRKRKKSGDW